MIIKFKAYACMKDKECGWKRIEESIHETEIEAKKLPYIQRENTQNVKQEFTSIIFSEKKSGKRTVHRCK